MTDLIAMRLAEMQRVHPQQDNSHVCSKCFAQVGIYPSGQRVMRTHPDVRIICSHCTETYDYKMLARSLAPGAENEVFESVPKVEGKLES
jgi:hypothetical protein